MSEKKVTREEEREIEREPEVIVKQKSGFLGKFLALLLGLILGLVAGAGGLVGGIYLLVAKMKIGGAVNTVNSITGLGIDYTQYIDGSYGEKTVLNLVGDAVSAVKKISSGEGTLNDLNAISPMVATLVLMVAGRGIAQLITDGTIITFDDPYLNFIGNGHFLTLPFTTWIAATLFTTIALLTRKTALGLFVESVGNNEKASRYAGIEARGVKWLVYAVSGFCAGVAGLMVSSNIKCADANHAGLYLELDAILATVIGGTSMAGGRFYLSGSLVGAVLIQTVATMMYANDVNPAIVAVPKAVIVIVVCLLQSETFRSKLSLAFSRKAKGGVA